MRNRNKESHPQVPDGKHRTSSIRPIPSTDRDHVKFVAKQPCLICGRRPVDPHHLRFTQQRALGRKVVIESPCPYAAAIIARPIALVMRPRGGKMPALTQRLLRARSG